MVTKEAIKYNEALTNEIQSLKNLVTQIFFNPITPTKDHPNIIQLIEIYENDEYVFLVQE
jgi:hypothetical protein